MRQSLVVAAPTPTAGAGQGGSARSAARHDRLAVAAGADPQVCLALSRHIQRLMITTFKHSDMELFCTHAQKETRARTAAAGLVVKLCRLSLPRHRTASSFARAVRVFWPL